jgi:energy-coupling factor transport system ATP-binding protein
VLLLGPSGAGKSTLLRVLAGLVDEHAERRGVVQVGGGDPRTARRGIGFVHQDAEAGVVMARVGDDVAFGLENRAVDPAAIPHHSAAALRAVGFPYGPERPTTALSGGELQRLVLAGALAPRPGLLLLDEPTANLDPAAAALVVAAVAAACPPTTTLVVVEHRTALWLPVVDRVIVLDRAGRVEHDGPPSGIAGPVAAQLAKHGVWVPDPPVRRPAAGPATRAPATAAQDSSRLLLTADGVGVDGRLDPTDLHVDGGEVLAVVGPSGAGKSTLARLLGGLATPSRGTVRAAAGLAGDLPPDPARWRAPALAARIGSVFQNPEHQFVTSRVQAELALGGTPAPRVAELLERLGLDALADANPFTLSGGEQRRLSVATALAHAPPLLVLDEPTFGQDLHTWQALVDLLAEHRAGGGAAVAVTHDDALVDVLADRVTVLP